MRTHYFLSLSCLISINAYAVGNLENPVAGSTESGISVVSGWHCTGKEISIYIDGIYRGNAGSGTLRADTESVCGHPNTGFSRLTNWNNLDPGLHTISVYADGELIDTRQFNSVRSAGEPFVTGLSKVAEIPNFPSAGQSVRLEWREAKQSFVVTGIGIPTALEVEPNNNADQANPAMPGVPIIGQIANALDTDWFAVTATDAGVIQVVFEAPVCTSNCASAYGWNISVIDSAGTFLSTVTSTVQDETPLIFSVQVPAGGEYFVRVAPRYQGTTDLNYTVTISGDMLASQ